MSKSIPTYLLARLTPALKSLGLSGKFSVDGTLIPIENSSLFEADFCLYIRVLSIESTNIYKVLRVAVKITSISLDDLMEDLITKVILWSLNNQDYIEYLIKGDPTQYIRLITNHTFSIPVSYSHMFDEWKMRFTGRRLLDF